MEIFEKIINECLQGLCIVIDNKIVFANPAFLKMFEYSEEELIGKDFCSLVHEKDKNKLYEYEKKRTKKEKIENTYDYRGITKSGKLKYIRCYSNNIDWEGKIASQLLLVDLTKEIKEKEEQDLMLNNINENITIGLWRVDKNKSLIYANSSFCNIFENNFDSLKDQEYLKYFNKKDRQIFNSSNKKCSEIEITLGDGINKWIKITSTPTSDGSNVGTIMDITKNKTVIPELIKLKEELKQERALK